MKQLISLLFFFFIFFTIKSQDGAPLLTHFSESKEIENQNWAICQNENRVMLFANRKGILSFDGEEWSPLKIPIIPFSMQMNPNDNKIYIGGENNFGFIEKQKMGTYTFVSLSGDSSNLGLITKIVINDSIVWFYGDKTITGYNIETKRQEIRHISKPGFPFTGMINTPGGTFINVSNKGLFRIEGDTLLPLFTGYLTEKSNILFSLPYNLKMVLVGTSDGKLSLFDGIKYYDYPVQDDGYMRDNILSEGINIGDSLYAFSTLNGGAVVLDKDKGKVRFIINNQNGLPDNEVFAIGNDKSGGLWLSHQFGLTRAVLNLPVANFTVYPGLKGNLTTSLTHNNELYVATSEGVFYLAKEKSYSEVDVLVKNDIIEKVDPVASENSPSSLISPNQQGITPEQPNNRKNIFTRIFGKKTTQVIKEPEVKSKEPEFAITTPQPVIQYKWKKISKLKSISYIYKKIDGLNEKCRQLVSTKDGILAATNRGLFVIRNYKASVIAGNSYINFISWVPKGETYSVATDGGYFLAVIKNGRWSVEIPDISFTNPLYSIVQTGENSLWMGGENTAYRVDLNRNTGKAISKPYTLANNYPQRYLIKLFNDSVFLFGESGINYYDKKSDSFVSYKGQTYSGTFTGEFIYPLSNIPLTGYGGEWIFPAKGNQIREKEISLLKLFDEIVSVNIGNDMIWIVDGENQLYGINRKMSSLDVKETDLFIKNIQNESGTSFDLSDIVFNRGDNVINFKIVAPGYLKQNLTQYQYFINKSMDDWSPWSTQTSYSRVIPKSGEYTLQVRAKDLWGSVGEPVSIKFTIKAPFIKTTPFYLIVIFTSLLIIFFIVRFREKQFQEKNRILEEKVKERTAEIEAQKEEITSSIEYASRIQLAMLPMTDLFKESFSEYFIIFKPRNIVSGDFYWIGEDEKHIFLTVADCTGHGVPGAFMSTLGISVLNEIITHNRDLKANTVLNLLREKIKTALHQTGKEGEAADGMDISLCVFRKNRKSIQYSGAYNPLYISTGSEFKEYKADRMPIGIHYGNEASFTNYEINVKKGDAIYILSDGFTDQFGGPENSKYKKANLRTLLSEIYFRPMEEQKRIIECEYEKWKGKAEQVDDITIIGVRI
jgi:serine phosphatase RsbU (regulator of sigma subunit)